MLPRMHMKHAAHNATSLEVLESLGRNTWEIELDMYL